MSGLSDIERFRISGDTLETTLAWLAEAGHHGNEAFVLWSGRRAGTTLEIRRAIKPRQTPQCTPDGLLVHVAGDALTEVNMFCYQHGEVVAAQVHAHPTEAFHSTTDDQFPLVTLLGSLSVVVPDFARRGREDIDTWTRVRLVGDRTWATAPPEILEVVS